MKKALTQINEQRLSGTRNPDFTTKPTKLNTSRNGHKVLEGIARKWASRGYYPSPSAAMKALTEGCHE